MVALRPNYLFFFFVILVTLRMTLYCYGKKHYVHQCNQLRTLYRVGWDGMGWDEMGWDGMGWNGMRWDGMRWNGMGWDGIL